MIRIGVQIPEPTRRNHIAALANGLFIGLDASKLKISVAVAEGERNGEVRFFGDSDLRRTARVAAVIDEIVAAFEGAG